MWASGRHERLAKEADQAHEKRIAEAEGLIIAKMTGERDVERALRKRASDALIAERDRLERELGVALLPRETLDATTEAAPPDPEIFERWLVEACDRDPLELPGAGDLQPEPQPWYATVTEARLETEAGSLFAVGEVVVRIQRADAPDASDPVLWSSLFKAETTDLFHVEPPKLRGWRLDVLVGLTSDPGWALGAKWQGRGRLGFWGLYQRPFSPETLSLRDHQSAVETQADSLLGGISLTLGRR